jgi:methylglyoxal reductase
MQLRQLGSSDLEVTPVIFGAWAIGGWWWGGTDDDDAVEAINAALDAGINCIDTAPMYGFGHSERVVGEAIKGRRDEVVIATKCGLRWDLAEGEHFFDDTTPERGSFSVYRNLRRDSILWECEQSLERLGVEVIDLYQCHWSDNTTPLSETMAALSQLLEDGLVRAIGVSNFTSEMIEECLKYGPLHTSQPKFSLLTRAGLADMIPFCHEHNIASIVYSSMEQGVLTGKVTPGREYSDGDKRAEKNPWFRPENLERALKVLRETVQPIADAHNATLAQVALAWTIAEPGITCALAGARTADQARENAAAMQVQLSEGERAAILGAFEALGEPA